MRKTITYPIFLTFSVILVFIFLSARTYPQLIVAILLYPLVFFFAMKIFPRKIKVASAIVSIKRNEPMAMPIPTSPAETTTQITKSKVDVADIEKRAFLKLIGTAGLTFFLFSIFNKRVTKLPYIGKIAGPDTTAIEDLSGNKINPSQTQPTDGYKISEIDDNIITFYGFIKKGGDWFIMKVDTDTGSFRYVKGSSKFSNNWDSREKLNYDYYSNVF